MPSRRRGVSQALWSTHGWEAFREMCHAMVQNATNASPTARQVMQISEIAQSWSEV